MNRTIVLALIAGLAGGMATRYIAPPVAFAQNSAPVTKEIRAQSFAIVDASDRVVGTFAAEPIPGQVRNKLRKPGQGDDAFIDPNSMRIVLRNAAGREIWSAGPDDQAKVQPLNLK